MKGLTNLNLGSATAATGGAPGGTPGGTPDAWAGAPPDICCPIGHGVFQDPVIAEDGYSYERRNIEKWFADHESSPKTNLVVGSKILIPNHALKARCVAWKNSYSTKEGFSKRLRTLCGEVTFANSTEAALAAVHEIRCLLKRACDSDCYVLGPKGVDDLLKHAQLGDVMDGQINDSFAMLRAQAETGMLSLKKKYSDMQKLRWACNYAVQTIRNPNHSAKQALRETKEREKEIRSAKAIAKKNLDSAQSALEEAEKVLESMVQKQLQLKKKMELESVHVKALEQLMDEFTGKCNTFAIEIKDLGGVPSSASMGPTPELSSSSSRSSLSLVLGKRGSSGNNLTTQKKAKQELHSQSKGEGSSDSHGPAATLFMEGWARYWGISPHKVEKKKGRTLIETSSAIGFPLADSYCRYRAWGHSPGSQAKYIKLFKDIAKDINFDYGAYLHSEETDVLGIESVTQKVKSRVVSVVNELQDGAESLIVAGNSIPLCDGGVKLLSEAILKFTCLKHISLRLNMMTFTGVASLASRMPQRIQTLNISENKIGDRGAIILADAMSSFTFLETLKVRRNCIGDSGARAVFASLQSTSVRKFDISENFVGNACVVNYIIPVLPQTVLIELSIHNMRHVFSDHVDSLLKSLDKDGGQKLKNKRGELTTINY
eukprot:g53.t1